MYRRFRKVKGLIREQVDTLDGFGLRTNRGAFEFERSAQKVDSFMAWLRRAQRENILGIREGTPIGASAQTAWANVYIDSAYQRGISHAAAEMRGQGATVSDRWIDSAFNRPIHADRVGLIYTRNFSELEGITQAMDQQISRILAQGIADGRNPRDLARLINDRVDKIGITRARMLARTEIISAHAEASLNSYEEAGLEGVNVKAEVLTAGDDRVCEICADLEDGGPYSMDEARGLIPAHPNCRCVLTPIIDNADEVDLR
jgi:SPP1 gp7 family putative phage head morphogenesis protein